MKPTHPEKQLPENLIKIKKSAIVKDNRRAKPDLHKKIGRCRFSTNNCCLDSKNRIKNIKKGINKLFPVLF